MKSGYSCLFIVLATCVFASCTGDNSNNKSGTNSPQNGPLDPNNKVNNSGTEEISDKENNSDGEQVEPTQIVSLPSSIPIDLDKTESVLVKSPPAGEKISYWIEIQGGKSGLSGLQLSPYFVNIPGEGDCEWRTRFASYWVVFGDDGNPKLEWPLHMGPERAFPRDTGQRALLRVDMEAFGKCADQDVSIYLRPYRLFDWPGGQSRDTNWVGAYAVLGTNEFYRIEGSFPLYTVRSGKAGNPIQLMCHAQRGCWGRDPEGRNWYFYQASDPLFYVTPSATPLVVWEDAMKSLFNSKMSYRKFNYPTPPESSFLSRFDGLWQGDVQTENRRTGEVTTTHATYIFNYEAKGDGNELNLGFYFAGRVRTLKETLTPEGNLALRLTFQGSEDQISKYRDGFLVKKRGDYSFSVELTVAGTLKIVSKNPDFSSRGELKRFQ